MKFELILGQFLLTLLYSTEAAVSISLPSTNKGYCPIEIRSKYKFTLSRRLSRSVLGRWRWNCIPSWEELSKRNMQLTRLSSQLKLRDSNVRSGENKCTELIVSVMCFIFLNSPRCGVAAVSAEYELVSDSTRTYPYCCPQPVLKETRQ